MDQADGPVVLQTLRNICQDADELTQRAQSFFRWLHEQTESEQADLASFLQYKEQLIQYLQQFVSELIARGGKIAARLMAIDGDSYTRLAGVAADEEVGEPRAGEIEQHSRNSGRPSVRGWNLPEHHLAVDSPPRRFLPTGNLAFWPGSCRHRL